LLSDDVAVVSVMWANNETGTFFPVEVMARMADEAGVMFHTDAVQAVGKIPIDLKNTSIHMLSVSGHKLHAPKGIGLLYLKRGTRYRPLLRGGHQERGRRAGTENAASIVAIGGRYSRCRAAFVRDRKSRGSSAEYGQHCVRIYRRRSDSVVVEQSRHCGVERFGVHIGIVGAIACNACDEYSLHRRSWHRAFFAVAL